MIEKMLKKKFHSMRLLAMAVCLIVSLAGCSADSVDSTSGGTAPVDPPPAVPEGSVLIDADTLNGWIDEGRLNNDEADEIVILDVNNADTDHIAGAQLWNYGTSLAMTRVEGPADASTSVLDAASMNALLDTFGIDTDTTIVLTSGSSQPFRVSRGYFTLRYWGFPKERIKVLNGYNGAWVAAGYSLTTDATPPQASTMYTVTDLASYTGDERMSLTEMITAVETSDGIAVDMRGDNRDPGSNNSFAGRMRGDKFVPYTYLYVNAVAVDDPLTGEIVDPQDLRFISAAELEEVFQSAGVDNSQKVLSYCTSGYVATTGFLALDGVLGWDVAVYDGSWNQWGRMSDYTPVTGGALPTDSVWRTDLTETMDVIIYRTDNGAGLSNMDDTVAFDDGNQIEDADYDSVYNSMP